MSESYFQKKLRVESLPKQEVLIRRFEDVYLALKSLTTTQSGFHDNLGPNDPDLPEKLMKEVFPMTLFLDDYLRASLKSLLTKPYPYVSDPKPFMDTHSIPLSDFYGRYYTTIKQAGGPSSAVLFDPPEDNIGKDELLPNAILIVDQIWDKLVKIDGIIMAGRLVTATDLTYFYDVVWKVYLKGSEKINSKMEGIISKLSLTPFTNNDELISSKELNLIVEKFMVLIFFFDMLRNIERLCICLRVRTDGMVGFIEKFQFRSQHDYVHKPLFGTMEPQQIAFSFNHIVSTYLNYVELERVASIPRNVEVQTAFEDIDQSVLSGPKSASSILRFDRVSEDRIFDTTSLSNTDKIRKRNENTKGSPFLNWERIQQRKDISMDLSSHLMSNSS